MNKRKILTMAMALAMVAILAVGGTLAYFTDSDAKKNVFTAGDVHIDLWEDFGDNDDTTIEELAPVTYDEKGQRKPDNVIEKQVYVQNTGSKDSYVRVHIAFPSMLDSGSEDEPQYAAYNNTLHWNFTAESFAEGKWNWNKDVDGANYPENGGNWNEYQTTIDGILYNVYVATYESVLSGVAKDTTVDAICQVYMDKKVTNEDVTAIKDVLGEKWNVYVVAEGCQTDGFANAYEALNTTFGKPGEYEVKWNANTTGTQDWTWVNND